MSLDDLYKVTRSRESTIKFHRNHRLLATTMTCSKCGSDMKIRSYKKLADEEVFYCPKTKCKATTSIRKFSFFENSRIPLADMLKIIYLWCVGDQAFIAQRHLPHLSEKTINDWYSFCRDIAMEFFKRNPVQFANENALVEAQIDESLFGKKQKYHKGKYHERFWVFGISDSKEHKCHVEVVHARDRNTLQEIIIEHIDPETNTRIISDGWSAYSKLEELGYKHEVVIHEREFKNTDGYHTNSIESIWSQMKSWISSMHGVKKELYSSYFSEFMYRYNRAKSTRGNCMKFLFMDISLYYNVRPENPKE